MSALLTTTMTYMKTVIDGFTSAGRGQIKMAVGGAPISQMFADEIGADGYGAECVRRSRSVLASGWQRRMAHRPMAMVRLQFSLSTSQGDRTIESRQSH